MAGASGGRVSGWQAAATHASGGIVCVCVCVWCGGGVGGWGGGWGTHRGGVEGGHAQPQEAKHAAAELRWQGDVGQGRRQRSSSFHTGTGLCAVCQRGLALLCAAAGAGRSACGKLLSRRAEGCDGDGRGQRRLHQRRRQVLSRRLLCIALCPKRRRRRPGVCGWQGGRSRQLLLPAPVLRVQQRLPACRGEQCRLPLPLLVPRARIILQALPLEHRQLGGRAARVQPLSVLREQLLRRLRFRQHREALAGHCAHRQQHLPGLPLGRRGPFALLAEGRGPGPSWRVHGSGVATYGAGEGHGYRSSACGWEAAAVGIFVV